MAEVSYPAPDHGTPPRAVTDAEYENVAGEFSGDGIYGHPTGADVVTAGTGLQVLVKAGNVGSVRGHGWEAGATDVPLAITSNASGSTRYDWVVLRLDRSTWTVRAAIVEGTPGAGYPSPSLDTGTTGLFDVCLGLVTVPPGAASVTVLPATRYVGSRIVPANSGRVPFGNTEGDIHYRPDTGAVELWNGSWTTLYHDSGTLTLNEGYSSWINQAGSVVRQLNGVTTIRIAKRRVESTFHSSDSNGSKIAVLPSGIDPPSHWQYVTGIFSNGAITRAIVRSDGEIWLDAPSKDVATGHIFQITITYNL